MKKISTCIGLCLLLTTLPAYPGGQLTTLDFTGFPALPPGPIPGSFAVGVIPMQWDSRCLPLSYTMNTLEAPNTLPPLDFDATREVMQRALDAWNDIPTSFIEMHVGEAEIQRPRLGAFAYTAFDFVNEINFLSDARDGWGAISPSVSFTADVVLSAGTDIDGDLDSDVFDPAAEGIETCADIDGDGDFELPAGTYAAGTMIDNDVSFSDTFVWTTGPPDAVFGNIDFEGISVHEFGHSHGLSHSAVNQIGPEDGTGATMLPGINSGDPLGELALRTPSPDDAAWSSFVYPEGTAESGLAALQPGDVAFGDVYGVITGEVTHGAQGLPLAGGHVFAMEKHSGELAAAHYTGNVRLTWIPGAFFGVLPGFPEFHLVDGRYTLPVPAGKYHLAIEAVDGAPVLPTSISTVTATGNILGQLAFNEEPLVKVDDGELEPRQVKVRAGETVTGIDHTTSVDVNLDSFDTVGPIAFLDFDKIGLGGLPPGSTYAVAVPAAEIRAVLDAGLVPKGIAYRLFLSEPSVVPTFTQASLAAGTLDEGGVASIDLEEPLVRKRGFLGQDNDYAPLYFQEPHEVAEEIEDALDDGASHLFLVLQWPETFDGLYGLPPFIGLDAGQQAGLLGRSFYSVDGESWIGWPTFNFMFRLVTGEVPDEDDDSDSDSDD